jgi:hypothetical protein
MARTKARFNSSSIFFGAGIFFSGATLSNFPASKTFARCVSVVAQPHAFSIRTGVFGASVPNELSKLTSKL